MPDFAVVTAFKSKDQVSGTFTKMSRSAGNFGNKTEKAFNRASRAGSGFGTMLKAILTAGFIQRGLSMITSGMKDVGKQFIDYEQSITAASAKFKDLNLETAEGQKQLLQLKEAARTTGALTEKTATEAAQGLGFWAMAGATAEQAMALLPGSVDLATIAEKDLARSTDIASDSLGAFGLMVEDTAQLQKNFTRLNDVMAKTMTSTNTDIETMFESVKKGAATFTAAGQSLETFQSLIGTMANAGVKGAESGTQLRNIILRLADPTKEAAAIMQNLGIRVKDQQGNFRDVIDILGDFEKATSKMGTAQRSAALSTVFGARAVTGINVIMKAGTESIRDFRTELENSGGTSQRIAETMRQSIQNRLAALQSSAIELGFQFMETFEKSAGNAISKLTEFLRRIPMREIMQDLQRLGPPISKVVMAVMTLGDAIMTILNVAIQAFTLNAAKNMSIIQVLSDIFTIVAGVIKSFAAGLKVLAPVLGPIAAAIAVWTAVQWALNIALSANPIGIIIIAIGLLIAAIGFLVTNWDKIVTGIKSGAGKIWEWFSGLLDNPFFAAIGTIFLPFITIPALIVKHWEPIKKFFTDFYNNILKPIGEFFINTAGKIAEFVGGVVEGTKGLITAGIEGTKGIGEDIGSFVTGEEKREAPNKTELEARRIDMRGRIDFANAPEGTTAEFEIKGAPPVDLRGLGFNP